MALHGCSLGLLLLVCFGRKHFKAHAGNTGFGSMAALRNNNEHLFFNLALAPALRLLFGF